MLSTVQDLAENTSMTIIYVTHYTEEILPCFENCMLMRAGCMYAQGKTEDLFTDQKISALLEYPVHVAQLGERMQVRLNVDSCIRMML